ncbi:MAG: PTS transporter subunit EIIC [Spirochaetaceae bacterium]|jgi:PTS system cellobiose-specific IIC component|nr:PTS transporter subunit EIIC [Spirochaetaceae bacterium]
MKDFLNQKVVPLLLKIINTKTVQSFKNGMLYLMPLTIVGSLFLLVANFPWKPVVNLLTAIGLIGPLNQVVGATFGIMALVAVVAIAFEYCKTENVAGGLNAGVIALACFLIVQESFVTTSAGLHISDVIDKGWTGGRGIIAAIIIGLVSGRVYVFFIKRDIRIKLPEGVPEGIANSFNCLIPALTMFAGAGLVYLIFKNLWHITAIEAIYKVIQTPLQGMTDSLPGAIGLALIVPFLWFFGVHGSSIAGAIMGPILQANMLENQALLDAGVPLTVANGGHIVTQQFMDQFQTVTGGGMTIGIVLFISFFAKSMQNKQLGKLTLIPAFFNINEPILFGIPVVLNPIMAVPFIMMPIISSIILYFCQYTGIVPLFGAVMVPWTTPPIISGFIVGGVRIAILQTAILALSFFVYLPFIRKVDQMNLELEKNAA